MEDTTVLGLGFGVIHGFGEQKYLWCATVSKSSMLDFEVLPYFQRNCNTISGI